MVDRLALNFDEQLEFVLHADLSIKRLRPTETAAERMETDQDDPLAALDTEVAHLGLELNKLIPAVVDAFGGPAEV
jgi:recombination associated protein RdgC